MVSTFKILLHLSLNDQALNLLWMEFQMPQVKSRHGQPTRIRYNMPSAVMRRLRLLYIALLEAESSLASTRTHY